MPLGPLGLPGQKGQQPLGGGHLGPSPCWVGWTVNLLVADHKLSRKGSLSLIHSVTHQSLLGTILLPPKFLPQTLMHPSKPWFQRLVL